MDDLISRQTAKDMLWNERQRLNAFMDECAESNQPAMRYSTKIERNQVEADIDILDRVPSAQPTVTDCISRQQAIDKMQMFIDSLDKEATAYKSLKVAFNRCIIELKRMSSAQPEIIRCKDCKFTDGKGPIADGRYWCVLHAGFMDFCSDAERRTDE